MRFASVIVPAPSLFPPNLQFSTLARIAIRSVWLSLTHCSACRNGTSMISLILPPKSQIPMTAKMLADEYGTASNIKSRVNRLSVLSAITSAQQRLKLYNRYVSVLPMIWLVCSICWFVGFGLRCWVDFHPFDSLQMSRKWFGYL
jgi:hypothetical protein